MKYIVAALSLFLLSSSSYAFFFQKEKKTFRLAACGEKPHLKFSCCVYDQIEDSIKVNEWVSQAVLDKKKRTSMRGRANPCDALGIGIHDGVTYSYGASHKCSARSPIYKGKGEVLANTNLPALCKLKTHSAQVQYY